MQSTLRVALNAQTIPGASGGVAPFIANLVRALGQLCDGSETYVIIVNSQQQCEWLKPLLGPNQRFAIRDPSATPPEQGHTSFAGLLKRTLGPLLPTARYLQKLINIPRKWPEVPISDGFYENLECDLIHFATQYFALCAVPAIYNPHDLQHLHYPQFWTPYDIAWRETIYPAGCHFARTVVVGSQWVKDDVVRQYRIGPKKVQIVAEAPPLQFHSKPSRDLVAKVKSVYKLEQPFGLYPAVTWPHKNHIRLLEGLSRLRDTCGLTVRLVCTGARDERFWADIARCIDGLRLQSQVKFLGFIPEEELSAVYQMAQFLVMPSLFEAVSLPIFDAWAEGVPVACSNVTAVPDQVLDAALLFDPHSVESIASAISTIATDEQMRAELRRRGTLRVKDFDWERTAKAYRAVYRQAAGRTLTEEDHWLLSCDWMRESRRCAKKVFTARVAPNQCRI
jgi:glycosyltransferase involved in cell wall biosynthesis